MQPTSDTNATQRKPIWRRVYNWTVGSVLVIALFAAIYYVFLAPVKPPTIDLGQQPVTREPAYSETFDRVTRQCNNAAADVDVTTLKPCLTGAMRGTIKHGYFAGSSNVYGRISSVNVAAQSVVSDVMFNDPTGNIVFAVLGRVGAPNSNWSDWRLVSRCGWFTANTSNYSYDVVVLYTADASSPVVPSTVADDIAAAAGLNWPTMMKLLSQP